MHPSQSQCSHSTCSTRLCLAMLPGRGAHLEKYTQRNHDIEYTHGREVLCELGRLLYLITVIHNSINLSTTVFSLEKSFLAMLFDCKPSLLDKQLDVLSSINLISRNLGVQ